jgi:hypothetical protein
MAFWNGPGLVGSLAVATEATMMQHTSNTEVSNGMCFMMEVAVTGWANVKDEPRARPARLLRQQEA